MKQLLRLRTGRLLLAACLLTIPALYAQAPVPAEPAKGRVHSLKITVRDALTKQPVAGAAVVSWEAQDVPKTTTDGDAVATLSVPLEIPYPERMQRIDATVIDPRYPPRRVMWIAVAGRVRETLPPSYEFLLSPGITAGGIVRDEHGAPIAGVNIVISGSDYKGYQLGTDVKTSQEFSTIYTDEL